MRTWLITLGILASATVAAVAAEPAKMAESSAGQILVNAKGMTLYTFDKDTGGKSACDAKCLKMWPAFHAAKGAKAEGDFTLVKDSAGKEMWAYKGMPLYLYHEDKKAGDTKGDAKGGMWHVVKQ